jgi:hypothetical protein
MSVHMARLRRRNIAEVGIDFDAKNIFPHAAPGRSRDPMRFWESQDTHRGAGAAVWNPGASKRHYCKTPYAPDARYRC